MSNNSELDRILAALYRNQKAERLGGLRSPLPRYGYSLLQQAPQRKSQLSTLLGNWPQQSRQAVKRKAFFSFHFDDVMRVNNVRNAFKIYNPETLLTPTFYDSSLWESKELEGDEALKRLIREGVANTSVVCVLVGSETWKRPWVRYEIARSVIDEKGLLAIDINHINHHQTRTPHPLGTNPLEFMAVGKMRDSSFRLFEKIWNGMEWVWIAYGKHTLAVQLPKYLPDPAIDYVVPLDQGAKRYNFDQGRGHDNIGFWLDTAAKQVGK